MSDRKQVLELFEQNSEFYRTTVQDNIEKYRKGDANIVVKDKNGNMIPHAKVHVEQKNHAFRYGANLFMLDELESDEKNAAYKSRFAEICNMATLPFYWNTLEPEPGHTRYSKDSEKIYRRPPIDLCMEYCEKNGIEPREHALAYDNHFPSWLADKSVPEIKKALEKRYAEISERYADKIRTIEVTNEMEWKKGVTAFYDAPDYIEWCFKLARKYFPKNQLCINEHAGLCFTDACRATDKYYAYIEANMLKGAPIDAIGMQFHMFFNRESEYNRTRPYYDPLYVYKHLDMYANFGKPIQLTEITIPAYSAEKEDEEIQAQIIDYLYSLWFSHPAVEQIIYWNLIDGYAHLWSKDQAEIKASQGDMTRGENVYYGGLLRFDMTPKPAFYKIKELFTKRWHTSLDSVSDGNGQAAFRGFYGDYDVTLEVNGKTVTKQISLQKDKENDFVLTI